MSITVTKLRVFPKFIIQTVGALHPILGAHQPTLSSPTTSRVFQPAISLPSLRWSDDLCRWSSLFCIDSTWRSSASVLSENLACGNEPGRWRYSHLRFLIYSISSASIQPYEINLPWNASMLKHLSSHGRFAALKAFSSAERWGSYGVMTRKDFPWLVNLLATWRATRTSVGF